MEILGKIEANIELGQATVSLMQGATDFETNRLNQNFARIKELIEEIEKD